MKYIELFRNIVSDEKTKVLLETKEEFENFFKDKIDWKFYNYLHDKFTQFSDIGKYTLRIEVLIKKAPAIYDSIYDDNAPEHPPIYPEVGFSLAKQYYEKNKQLYYNIVAYRTDIKDTEYNMHYFAETEVFTNYLKMIESKIFIVEKHLSYVIVKPTKQVY